MRIRLHAVAAVSAVAALTTAGLIGLAGTGEAATPSPLQVYAIQYNPPGTDNAANLNNEYIAVKNVSKSPVAVTNWTVFDTKNHVYKFGASTLGPGVVVYVHTGKGKDTYNHRYQQRGWYVWNNTGRETATLRSPNGSQADKCTYTGVAKGLVYC